MALIIHKSLVVLQLKAGKMMLIQDLSLLTSTAFYTKYEQMYFKIHFKKVKKNFLLC